MGKSHIAHSHFNSRDRQNLQSGLFAFPGERSNRRIVISNSG